MNSLVIFPIVIPLLGGLIVFFFRGRPMIQRWLSALTMIVTVCQSLYVVYVVSNDGIQALQLGGWTPPFGITLVADMFTALLVLTVAVVSLACLLFAFHALTKEQEHYYFYTFFLFLVVGVNGSFLTGDLFNLFVFFEVMLLASYVLISFGGKKFQLRESLKYILINIISSTLFVVAIGYLYSVTGTLNMAHLSERIALAGQDGLLTTISLLFLIVFGLKSALFLYFWLPGAYRVVPISIIAMFAALLTKVGIYAIFRTFTLMFYHQPDITHSLLIWMAALTMLLGAIGAVAQNDVKKILVYNVIISVGFIVFGLGVSTVASLTGSVFYLIHDIIVKALIFLLGGMAISLAKTSKLQEMSGLIRHHPILGWLFFLSSLALAGIPPLSGFVGKVLVLQGGLEQEYYIVAGVGLLTSLLVLYSMLKIFIDGFWGEAILSEEEGEKYKARRRTVLIPCLMLAALVVGMGLAAEPVLLYIEQAVNELMDPNL